MNVTIPSCATWARDLDGHAPLLCSEAARSRRACRTTRRTRRDMQSRAQRVLPPRRARGSSPRAAGAASPVEPAAEGNVSHAARPAARRVQIERAPRRSPARHAAGSETRMNDGARERGVVARSRSSTVGPTSARHSTCPNRSSRSRSPPGSCAVEMLDLQGVRLPSDIPTEESRRTATPDPGSSSRFRDDRAVIHVPPVGD